MPLRMLLRAWDPVIYYFMRSDVVKTVLVDRGSGEEARRSRLRSVECTIDLLARRERVLIFFEGGRSRIPYEIRPAQRGIGRIVLGLQARGIRLVVITIHHRGLEHVIPINSRHWLTSGHRIDIRWSEFVQSGDSMESIDVQDSQKMADDIRTSMVRLQSSWRSEIPTDD